MKITNNYTIIRLYKRLKCVAKVFVNVSSKSAISMHFQPVKLIYYFCTMIHSSFFRTYTSNSHIVFLFSVLWISLNIRNVRSLCFFCFFNILFSSIRLLLLLLFFCTFCIFISFVYECIFIACRSVNPQFAYICNKHSRTYLYYN